MSYIWLQLYISISICDESKKDLKYINEIKKIMNHCQKLKMMLKEWDKGVYDYDMRNASTP